MRLTTSSFFFGVLFLPCVACGGASDAGDSGDGGATSTTALATAIPGDVDDAGPPGESFTIDASAVFGAGEVDGEAPGHGHGCGDDDAGTVIVVDAGPPVFVGDDDDEEDGGLFVDGGVVTVAPGS